MIKCYFFQQVYGLGVQEIDENVKQYMLVNEVEHMPEFPLVWSESQKNEQTLLLPVLAIIFMNGGSIPEGKSDQYFLIYRRTFHQ